MKKLLLTTFCCAFAVATYAQSVVSNHSVSTSTLLSLEYAYEQALGDKSTIVLRAGLPNRMLYDSYANESSISIKGRSSWAYGITIEPRIYTNIERRANYGRNTYNNSGSFVALRLQGTLGTPNYPTGEVCLVPMYGIHRAWNEHWYGELTVGGGVSYATCFDGLNFKPHLQYRVGFAF